MKMSLLSALLLGGFCLALLPPAAQAQANDVSGAWHFVLVAGDGNHDIDAEFKVDSGKVTGKWGNADVKGTFQDGQLDLSFPFEYAEGGMTGTMHLVAKLSEGKLAGSWQYAGYDGSFTATRPPKV